MRLGQTAQKQQRPRCPNPKIYLEIRRVDERLLRNIFEFSENLKRSLSAFVLGVIWMDRIPVPKIPYKHFSIFWELSLKGKNIRTTLLCMVFHDFEIPGTQQVG